MRFYALGTAKRHIFRHTVSFLWVFVRDAFGEGADQSRNLLLKPIDELTPEERKEREDYLEMLEDEKKLEDEDA